ncbi:unknown [Feldmannia species virus]|uniref:Uncharacterized protein n=1 Tax=Feldmannia species virus TaxID=39420 RepID=B5LWH1_9PHYC|nr:hypothetical protein FeldSpV_gp082 [Feldmannia species virus]ACH46834.1 unknown [Feldmannia species virus]
MSQRAAVERELRKLPTSFSSAEIRAMCNDLKADVGLGLLSESRLYAKHKVLAYAYPSLFFKIVRGEFDLHIFESLLKIKSSLDRGEITDERAKQLVVLGAKEQLASGSAKKMKPKSDSSTSGELTFECVVDEKGDFKMTGGQLPESHNSTRASRVGETFVGLSPDGVVPEW